MVIYMKIILDNTVDLAPYLAKDSIYDEIYLKSGIYAQKLTIFKDNLTIIGEENTIITNHDHYYKIYSDNKEYNTFRTYTLKVMADNVKIKNLTIENSCVPSSKYGQSVALHVMGNNFICENSIIKGAQDTLFTGPLPKNLLIRYKDFLPDDELTGKASKQQYLNCTIYGDVDFIFGGATAYFYKCNIICIGSKGYVCAPSHYEETPYGYLFNECTISYNGIDSNPKFYLARPWRKYAIAAFINCSIGNHILKEGFNDWNDESRQKTVRFFEYDNNESINKRVPYAKILTKDEATNYLHNYLRYLNN